MDWLAGESHPIQPLCPQVVSHRKSAKTEGTQSAAAFLDRIQASLEVDTEESRQQRAKALEGLSIALRGQTLSFCPVLRCAIVMGAGMCGTSWTARA